MRLRKQGNHWDQREESEELAGSERGIRGIVVNNQSNQREKSDESEG